MAGLGDLVVNLSANTQKFDKNISKSQSGLKAFGAAAMSAINPVTAAIAGMAAGAVGLGAAVWGLQGRIGTLAGVADKAAQTGLSGAFLQQLEFAADQSGVSAETLTGGVKKLTIMIGKAAEGSKEAADTLKQFGLNAKELQTLSPEQQFLKIADKISQIPTAAGRASAAVKIFGKSGIEMTGLFAGGLDDITKLMQDAKDIGIGLDDKQLAQIAAADDSLQKMYASIGAMVDQVAVGLAPAFEAVATEVTGLIGPVTKLFDTFNNLDDKWTWASDTLVAAFDVAMETIKVHWKQMLADMTKEVSLFSVDVIPGVAAVRNVVAAPEPANNGPEGLQQAQGRLQQLLGQFKGVADENRPVDPPKDQFALDIEQAQKAFDDAVEKNAAFWLDDPAMKAASEALDRAVEEYGRGTDKWKEADEEHSRQLAKGIALRAKRDAAEKDLEKAKAAPEKAKAQERFNSGVSDLFEKIKDSASGGLLSDIGNAAGGMVDRAKIQAGAMGGMLDGWFSSFDEKKNQRELKPQLAGAMQAGSVEAYSTLVQAMMTRGKDPVVAATEKQTKELIKGLKPKREFKNIESFVSL